MWNIVFMFIVKSPCGLRNNVRKSNFVKSAYRNALCLLSNERHQRDLEGQPALEGQPDSRSAVTLERAYVPNWLR